MNVSFYRDLYPCDVFSAVFCFPHVEEILRSARYEFHECYVENCRRMARTVVYLGSLRCLRHRFLHNPMQRGSLRMGLCS